MLREMQLRLVYSMLRPAVRCAVRFSLPIRTLTELLRLATYEVLAERGLEINAIAERFGQTPRHVRSLRHKYDSDFFAAETEVGLPRAIEDLLTEGPRTARELAEHLPNVEPKQLSAALSQLESSQRIEPAEGDRWAISKGYVVLTSDKFHHRIDALNHHLDLVYQASMQRLVLDNSQTSAIKTISFVANSEDLNVALREVEGILRKQIADLEERARFAGEGHRFSLGLSAAPVDDAE